VQNCEAFEQITSSMGLFQKFCCFHLKMYGVGSGAVVLRRCITSQKLAGSIPDGIVGIFH
jgi:hypothetical protein